jgi:hypothetical protein
VYNAARLAPLNANDHELVRKSAEQVAEALKPKELPPIAKDDKVA